MSEVHGTYNSIDSSIQNSMMFNTIKHPSGYENALGLQAKSTGKHTTIPAAQHLGSAALTQEKAVWIIILFHLNYHQYYN